MMKRTLIGICALILSMLPARPCLAEEEFVIGLIPEENIFKQIKRHLPLQDYLSERLGVKVRFTILSKYGDIIDRFTARDMDGAFFGIFTALLAQEKIGVEPIVRPMNPDKSTTATGFLITRKDSNIQSIEGGRGKRAVFVDRATATGYIFVLALLKEIGVDSIDNYFSEYDFVGSHDAAVNAVLNGRADIGAVKSRILNQLSAKDPIIKEDIRIIAQSEPLPDTTLCISKDVPIALKIKMKEVLLNMDKEPSGREVLKKLGALKFVPAVRKDFDSVTELARKAGIADIKNYRYR